jgi:5'-3' exoribonuclease 1
VESRKKQGEYTKAAKLASSLNLHPTLLSRLTSCILVEDNKTNRRFNVGLYLKSHGKKLKLIDYTRFNQREWEYSPKACKNITEYIVS